MKYTQPIVLALALTVASGPVLADGEAKWTEDVKAAMAQAQKEGKDLLMDFTGSDWCGWCIRLDKEVFANEPFITKGPKHFVLVKLDFPRRRQMPAATKKQNAAWRDKLGVRGYPTIFVLDAQGRPYGKTGYRRGGAEPYLQHLMALRQTRVQRDKHFDAAKKLSGADKAKALDKGLSLLDFDLVSKFYRPVIDEIVKLDADDAAGLKSKYQSVQVWASIQDLLAQRKYDEAVKKIDAAIAANPTGQVAQDLLLAKGDVLYRRGNKDGSKAALTSAIAAAPQGNKVATIQRILKQAFK